MLVMYGKFPLTDLDIDLPPPKNSASLLLSRGWSPNIVVLAPVLVSLWATACGHYLLTESQSMGDHAADAVSFLPPK